MAVFRKTWRHEMYIEAETEREAEDIWEAVNLGKLSKAVKDKKIISHDFVNTVSMEEEE